MTAGDTEGAGRANAGVLLEGDGKVGVGVRGIFDVVLGNHAAIPVRVFEKKEKELVETALDNIKCSLGTKIGERQEKFKIGTYLG